MEKSFTPSLWICILLDLIGCASYALPMMGEVTDVLWAPISAFIFYRMFGGTLGTFGGIFNFMEELFPGTDIIPTFTIAWVLKKVWFGRSQMSFK
ncbi:hypothetical protein [Chitinophaga defluvii]|uniref:Uncharacterized protein n=1 Tax=Chitinophaga defluvii TaxID=3163343 RepID=A0ABV2T8A7_9BACT